MTEHARSVLLCGFMLAACGGSGPGDDGSSDGGDGGTDGSDAGTDAGEDSGQDSGATATDGGTDSAAPPDTLELAVSIPAENPLAAVVRFTSASACAPTVVATRGGEEAARTGRPDETTDHELLLVGLYAGVEHELVASCGDERGHTTLRTDAIAPGSLVETQVVVPGTLDGWVALPNGNGPITPGDPLFFAVDDQGEVRWLYISDSPYVQVDGEIERLDDGTLKLLTPDWVRRIDLAGRVLEEVEGIDVGLVGLHHDAVVTPDGGWLLLGHDERVLPTADGGEERVLGDQLVQIDADHEIVWTWSTFDHLDVSERNDLVGPDAPEPEQVDWTHGNGLQWVPDPGAWLLALRNLHRVVLIDPATDDILWSLGVDQDFTLDAGQWFYGAHAPDWSPADGTLMLFDNGLGRPETLDSRAVRYRIDAETGVATEIWSHELGAVSATQGDVDRLPGDRVLVFAGALEDDAGGHHAEARVVDARGEVLWQLRMDDIGYRAEFLPVP